MKGIVSIERSLAHQADQAIKEMVRRIGKSWVELAIAVIRFHDADFHRQLGYQRFDVWATETLGRSKDWVYRMMRIVRELASKIPVAEVEQISKENCEALLELPESKRLKPEIIEQAKTLSTLEFSEVVEREGGEWVRRERDRRMVWSLPQSLYDVITNVIEIAKKVEGTDSTQVALEAIFSHYLTDFESSSSK